ncbi:hypothetical protein LWI29_031353 [Acer saccharum]|uniref:Pectinesterase n=1 Tax=Acer saccharum TaxID=4024 RepID=A0AA39W4K7_ACESA|nr:hypothetical protein LWI29_031353 [Acer saccharum]
MGNSTAQFLQSSIAKLFKESSLEESEHAHKLMEYQALPQFLSSPPSSFVRCIISAAAAAAAVCSLHHPYIRSDFVLVKDISIVNNAGPEGEQAVALRTAGNFIACLRCSIEGFQDTLYADEGKNHFFFNCEIYGTIDFIFGAASVVIQNSTILARRPLDRQYNVITADGRTDTANNAIVIHKCSIIPTPELKAQSNVKTYLGRPWKTFSRTIIMQSNIDGFIDSEGWVKFRDSSDVTTLYYAEFWNSGPGSNTTGRVNWPGFHILTNLDDVQVFTVDKFINGSEWLKKLDVPYFPGLV